MAIGLNRMCLNIVGVWPEPDASVNNRKSFLKYAHVPIVILLIVVGSLLPQAYALTLVLNEIPLFLDNVSQTIAVAVSISKLLLLWLHHKSLRTVVASIKFDWLKTRDNFEESIMINQAKRGRELTLYGITIMTLSLVGVIIGPMFGISHRTVNNITDFGDRYVPLQSYYPYDVSISPYFEISYLFQAVGTGLTCVCFASPVSLFGVLVFHSCGQLEILTTKIKNIKLTSDDEKIAWINLGIQFHRNLKDIVKEHVRVLRTVSIIEHSFKEIVFAQLASVTVAMTCMGVQFVSALETTGKTPPLQQMIILAGPISAGMLITFVYCFAGESLMNYYAELNNGVFQVDWHMMPRRNATDLLFMMTHSKNPLRLTAGKFLFLSLESFCSILKSSGGYFSMLIAVRDK